MSRLPQQMRSGGTASVAIHLCIKTQFHLRIIVQQWNTIHQNIPCFERPQVDRYCKVSSLSRSKNSNKLSKKRWGWSKKLTKWSTKTMSRSTLTKYWCLGEPRARLKCLPGDLSKIIKQVPVPNSNNRPFEGDSRTRESLRSRNEEGLTQTRNLSQKVRMQGRIQGKMPRAKRFACCRRKRIDTRPN